MSVGLSVGSKLLHVVSFVSCMLSTGWSKSKDCPPPLSWEYCEISLHVALRSSHRKGFQENILFSGIWASFWGPGYPDKILDLPLLFELVLSQAPLSLWYSYNVQNIKESTQAAARSCHLTQNLIITIGGDFSRPVWSAFSCKLLFHSSHQNLKGYLFVL